MCTHLIHNLGLFMEWGGDYSLRNYYFFGCQIKISTSKQLSFSLLLFNQSKQAFNQLGYNIHHRGILSPWSFFANSWLTFLSLTWSARFFLILDLCSSLCSLRFILFLGAKFLHILTRVTATFGTGIGGQKYRRFLWLHLFILVLDLFNVLCIVTVVARCFFIIFICTYSSFLWGCFWRVKKKINVPLT